METVKRIIPKVSKKGLLFLAGICWLGTSLYLVIKGALNIISDNTALLLRFGISIPIGVVIYIILFRKLILRHLYRIFSMESQRTHILNILDVKGYILLLAMTILSVGIELYRMITLDYLYSFQATMSVPVFLCALHFFRAWKNYDNDNTTA